MMKNNFFTLFVSVLLAGATTAWMDELSVQNMLYSFEAVVALSAIGYIMWKISSKPGLFRSFSFGLLMLSVILLLDIVMMANNLEYWGIGRAVACSSFLNFLFLCMTDCMLSQPSLQNEDEDEDDDEEE